MAGEYKRGLLERIAEEMKCDYISDLHDVSLYSRMVDVVEKIQASEYSQDDWEDAVSYILAVRRIELSSEEAKKLLLHHLGWRGRKNF